ncbi:hypothetical protein HELRODRAFT_182326 [Helobdella robusta]|uniref:Uncharacterized protein n=1 Tax=Helobdella robusta TaxID=6412 RepID=T1FI24_HELRO|nr:hypothetical protein HELRODRAFT_182326 [Helobdella robusta]ESN91073.1 hypothetical protein HELRODRAFT_182326 [Helobdella robusta]
MAPTLQQCPVCFNHYRSTPDGKLCRHGGKVKGQECSGSRKKVDSSGARAASSRRPCGQPKLGVGRPDGCTLIPWRAGRCLAWDVAVPSTLAERYVNLTSKECGLAAARAADEKMKKYGNALPSMEFLPICIEVLGPMDPNTLKFLKAICKMISVRSGDSRELFFATNHISCLLQRCFQRANIPTIKEPTGLMEEGSLRPDGYTISPWAQGRFLAWDVTFPHTMAERYINFTSQEAGAAALRAADFKNSKYAALAESKIFQPVCIETFGPTDAQTQSFLNELCSRIVEISGDPLDKSYVKQSFSILLQK